MESLSRHGKISCLTIRKLQSDWKSSQVPDLVLPGLWAGTVGCLMTVGLVDKGMFLFEIAAQITDMLKQHFLNIPMEQHGSVVIFAGDDTAESCLHRTESVRTFVQKRPQEDDTIYDEELDEDAVNVSKHRSNNLKIYPALGYCIDLLNPQWIDKIKPLLKGVRLCIFDPIARFDSTENHQPSSGDKLLSILEQLARETGCAILFTHDIGGVLHDLVDGLKTTPRYQTLIEKTVWQSSLSVMSEDEAKRNYQRVGQSKRENFLRFRIHKNNGAPIPDFWLERRKYGFLTQSEIERNAFY